MINHSARKQNKNPGLTQPKGKVTQVYPDTYTPTPSLTDTPIHTHPPKNTAPHTIYSHVPHFGAHAGGNVGVVVKDGGSDVEEDLDVHGGAQVVDLRHLFQLLQHLNHLRAVRALLATSSDDLIQLLCHCLVVDLLVLGKHLWLLLKVTVKETNWRNSWQAKQVWERK